MTYKGRWNPVIMQRVFKKKSYKLQLYDYYVNIRNMEEGAY